MEGEYVVILQESELYKKLRKKLILLCEYRISTDDVLQYCLDNDLPLRYFQDNKLLLRFIQKELNKKLNPYYKLNLAVVSARHYSRLIQQTIEPLFVVLNKYAKHVCREKEVLALEETVKTSQVELQKIFNEELREHRSYYMKKAYISDYKQLIRQKHTVEAVYYWKVDDALRRAIDFIVHDIQVEVNLYTQIVEYFYKKYISQLLLQIQAFEDIKNP